MGRRQTLMNTLKQRAKKSAWAALSFALLAGPAGMAVAGKTGSAPISTLAQSSVSRISRRTKSDYENTLIHLSRISLTDCYGRRVSGWQIIRFDRPYPMRSRAPRPWDAYDTLYSPDLRSLLKGLPRGTVIGLETSPAALTYPPGTKDPDEREIKDFSDYCRTQGLRFFSMPIS